MASSAAASINFPPGATHTLFYARRTSLSGAATSIPVRKRGRVSLPPSRYASIGPSLGERRLGDAVEDELVVLGVDHDLVAGGEALLEQSLGELVLDLVLDHPPQRAGAK